MSPIEADWARLFPAGFLHLRQQQVVLARWFWVSEYDSQQKQLFLCAARCIEDFMRLRDEVTKARHVNAAAKWEIVTGGGWQSAWKLDRQLDAGADLVLSPAVRQRVRSDIIGFFDESVAALYRSLGVPYRRGVLLHGPPGNGKTSLIRYVGAAVPRVPAMILCPSSTFDSDDMQDVVDHWSHQAPAILVIEDLDWLLSVVNVSRFLNMIDGIESDASGGMLLIATTNHPENLDPAINNRPGRFDVVLELPCPDRAMRLEHLRARLADIDASVLGRAADITDGLSFAHLQEVLKLSGLLAIHEGRSGRRAEDVIAAAEQVRASHDDAIRGFPRKPEVPFGLLSCRR